MNFSQRLTLELVFFIGKCEDWHFTIKQKSNIRGLSINLRLCWSSFSVCSTRFCIIPIYIYFTVCWNECVEGGNITVYSLFLHVCVHLDACQCWRKCSTHRIFVLNWLNFDWVGIRYCFERLSMCHISHFLLL